MQDVRLQLYVNVMAAVTLIIHTTLFFKKKNENKKKTCHICSAPFERWMSSCATHNCRECLGTFMGNVAR